MFCALRLGSCCRDAGRATPKYLETMRHQAAVFDLLISLSKALPKRVQDVETKLVGGDAQVSASQAHKQSAATEEDKSRAHKRRKTATTNLHDAWSDWHSASHVVRVALPRQKRSDLRVFVSFMRLFAGAYELDRQSSLYRDDVLRVGAAASANLQLFFAEHGANIGAAGTAQKVLLPAPRWKARQEDWRVRRPSLRA